MVAVTEAEMTKYCDTNNSLSFHNLLVWIREPLIRLKYLCAITDMVQAAGDKPFTEIIFPLLNHFRHHGDPEVQRLISRIETKTARPFIQMTIKSVAPPQPIRRS